MRRMTTGRGSEPLTQWRSLVPISSTSALSLSNRTVARRTVQTLIGSNVAFSTSTRPPDQRPEPSVTDPCRWSCPRDTDRAGAGGTALSMAEPECSRAIRRPKWRIRRGGVGSSRSGGDGIGAEYAHDLGLAAQALDRVGHRAGARVPLTVEEEHVAAQPLLERPRLDAREVHAAERELR